MNQDTKITELENRIKKLEDNRWVFPQRLSELEKKNLNNILFFADNVTLNASGEAHLPIPGLSLNNIVLVTYTSAGSDVGATIQVGSLGYAEVYIFGGTLNQTVNYVVFTTLTKLV